MNPTKFPRYSAPASLEQALHRAKRPDTMVLGGGTVLYPLLQRADVRTDELIDVFNLPETNTISAAQDSISVGAMSTYADILNEANVQVPALLRTAASTVTGGPQLRNQGTVGGSACYANPASDIPSVLVALGATLHLASEPGDRYVAASDFFVGPFTTSRQVDEVLLDIVINHDRSDETWGRYKLKSAEGSWPIGVASACLRPDPVGSGATVAVTLGALTETPVELPTLELSDCTTVSTAEQNNIQALINNADPRWWSDELADADYRSRVAATVATRAISAAITQRKTNG